MHMQHFSSSKGTQHSSTTYLANKSLHAFHFLFISHFQVCVPPSTTCKALFLSFGIGAVFVRTGMLRIYRTELLEYLA